MDSAVDKKELKYEDLLQSLNVFSSEFNNSSIHDRVLVFQAEETSEETRLCATRSENSSMASESVTDIQPDKDEEEVREEVVEDKVEVQDDSREQHELNDEEVEKNSSIKMVPHEEIKSDEQLNEHKILVHSCWLAVQSPYFKSLFFSGMKESHSKEVVMKIPQSEFQAYVTLIEAMYKPNILNNKCYKLVVQVLVLADKFDAELVFKKCKYVLMDTPLTLESCELIMKNVNHLPRCGGLFDCVKNFLVKEFTPLDKTWTGAEFLELSEPSLKLLLSSDNLAVRSENTVFVALMKWMEWNNNSPSSSWLLSLVRFELMTVDFLCDVVENHDIAEGMLGFDQCLREGLAYHCFSQERRDLMEDRPVQRPTFDDTGCIPALLWVIDMNVRMMLLVSPNTAYSTDFWYKGYQLVLKLKYEDASNSFSIYLKIKNITREACLNIMWTVESHLFVDSPINDQTTFGSNGLSCGYEGVDSDISLASVPEDVSHTIKVWIKQ